MKKLVTKILIILTIFLNIPFSSEASHLSKLKSDKALEYHNFRMEQMPKTFKTKIIPASTKPSSINFKSEPNKKIQKILNDSDLLSVLKFQDNQVIINEISSKLKEDDKMYSMSMAKSFIGYLVGHAVCDGYIALDQPMSRYVSETQNTIYSNTSIENMINMAAGDSPIWGKNYSLNEYTGPVLNPNEKERKTILEIISEKQNKSPENIGVFRYSNADTDLIARAIDTNVPNGLAGYFNSKLSEPAGNNNDMFFFLDKNSWPLSHAFLYATRLDYLRMAIKISSDWSKNDCIGNYLKDRYTNSVKTGQKDFKKYGGFFWFDFNLSKNPTASMNGHGGQRIIIDLKNNSIVLYHSIRIDFDQNKLENILFKN